MPFPLPKFIQFYPTFRCNQKCGFCFNSPRGRTSDMTLENALRLIDILSLNGIGEIDIMGGEPTLLTWMPGFIETAVKKGLSLNLSTNGSDADMVTRFADLDPERVHIGISLEGNTAEEHDRLTASHNFQTALRGIAGLVALKHDPAVKTVVSKITIGGIQKIVDLVKCMGVKRYYLIHMDMLTRDKTLGKHAIGYPSFAAFHEMIRDNNPDMWIFRVNASCFEKGTLPGGVRCAGGVRKLSIMPDGSVYPCNLFHHFPEFNLGNIFSVDLSAIWASPALDPFRRAAANACTLHGCANRAFCTGGCPAHCYFQYKKLEGPDVRCTS